MMNFGPNMHDYFGAAGVVGGGGGAGGGERWVGVEGAGSEGVGGGGANLTIDQIFDIFFDDDDAHGATNARSLHKAVESILDNVRGLINRSHFIRSAGSSPSLWASSSSKKMWRSDLPSD
ncbi:hypothetical protein L1987_80595 [Smallanthus sonchifolius]|uniref:Uncharacterized protein n=1 Tax=Smallanthus sonchifolius TaxID=185202 RepID=A0ACB8YSC3_9ASTR|nr:hypothetical protein L1987_80595 [Smallanthus sonchifolius]